MKRYGRYGRMYEREEDIDTLNAMLLHVSDNCSPEQIEKWLMKGADINARDVDGRTSLMIASENGETDVVKFLLESGADVNAKDEVAMTTLRAENTILSGNLENTINEKISDLDLNAVPNLKI